MSVNHLLFHIYFYFLKIHILHKGSPSSVSHCKDLYLETLRNLSGVSCKRQETHLQGWWGFDPLRQQTQGTNVTDWTMGNHHWLKWSFVGLCLLCHYTIRWQILTHVNTTCLQNDDDDGDLWNGLWKVHLLFLYAEKYIMVSNLLLSISWY